MPSARPPRAAFAAAAFLALAAATPAVAAAQNAANCPAFAVCYFGTDETGTSDDRAANVNSLAAQQAFLAALGARPAVTETFEDVVQGTDAPFRLAFGGVLGGSAEVRRNLDPTATDGDGRYPVSGVRYARSPGDTPAVSPLAIDFATAATGFGFYGTDVGDRGSQLTLRFTLVGGTTVDWLLPYVATEGGDDTARDGSLLYAGFVSPEAFTRVEFLGVETGDTFGVDDVTATVPEPGTTALAGLGLAALAAAARRRRAAR